MLHAAFETKDGPQTTRNPELEFSRSFTSMLATNDSMLMEASATVVALCRKWHTDGRKALNGCTKMMAVGSESRGTKKAPAHRAPPILDPSNSKCTRVLARPMCFLSRCNC
ncbi:hypothetical protein BaRGS_00010586 [Batillaria attramentaria]|uniref:Uncharacterized protein n=1 Tax=Batillaria attramentaria TaxID=370345 RepID=A0ABD0LFQ6_9CAEN